MSCSTKKRTHEANADVRGMKRKQFHLLTTCFGNFKDKVHLVAKEVKLLKVK